MPQPADPSRRRFVGTIGSGALAAVGTSALASPAANSRGATGRPTADAIVVLWVAGGLPSQETFDPKRHTPFERGMRALEMGSSSLAVPTALDGVSFCQGLEGIGRILDRGTLIRSVVGEELGTMQHAAHDEYWHSLSLPGQGVRFSRIGERVASALCPRFEDIPALVEIGRSPVMGASMGAFSLPHPGAGARPMETPSGAGYFPWNLAGGMRKAPPALARALDLSREPRANWNRYDAGPFGRGCLLARRLVEAGARYVEVATEWSPFQGWDMHESGHHRLPRLKRALDRPVARLVLELEERGLLERTLVVLASEFSRSTGPALLERESAIGFDETIDEPRHYGHHRHSIASGSVLLFGGATPRGRVVGRTDDDAPFCALDEPVTPADLHALIGRAVGLPPR